MSTTILGTDPNDNFPIAYAPPIVELKRKWTDDWAFDPELQFVSCAVHASSRELATAEVMRFYGDKKEPFETDFSIRSADNLRGAWIRIKIMGAKGPVTQFIGQIEAPTRNLKGNVDVPAGMQAWVAAGGLRFLQKNDISQSFFLLPGSKLSTIGWIPDMNAKDKRNTIVGNRSDSTITTGGSTFYCYGGKSTWTHRQYIDYLIANFIQQYDDTGAKTGPTWTLGGQTSILDAMKTTIRFGVVETAAEMLGKLIPPRYGIDYFVKPTEGAAGGAGGQGGFEITVYALTADDSSVAGVTLPKNPNIVTLDKTDQIDLVEVKLVETTERKVDSIIVLGKRIVVCGTLRGASGYTQGSSNGVETLTRKWSNALEVDYQTAGGKALTGSGPYTVSASNDAAENDRIRKSEKYRNVYQLFGAPATWDMDGGIWGVVCNPDGSITNEKTLKEQAAKQAGALPPPNYSQVSIRETLSWLPILEGYDYSIPAGHEHDDPPPAPVNNTINDGVTEPQQKPPMAWIRNDTPDTDDNVPIFVPVDQNGMSIHGAQNDWGIFVNASPNHLLALNHWILEPVDPITQDNLATTELAELKFDHQTLVATIAIESDHRLFLSYDVPKNLKAGDGSTMILCEEDAECWVLLPGTVIDVDDVGAQVDSGDFLRVLRNDKDRLALVLAGAIARYKNDRVRAALTINSHVAYGSLLGQILDTVQQGDDLNKVGGPITSVEWLTGSQPKTIVKTGYA